MKNAATALMCFVVGYFMGIQAPLRGTVQSVPPHSSAASAAECSKAASDVGHSLESGHPLSSDFLDAEEYPWHKNSLDGFHAGQWLNGLYALAHGYHYCVFTKRLRPDTRKPHWHKVLAVQHTLKVCRNVVLLDSDAAIHDFDLRLEPVFDEFLGAGTGKHMALAVDWPQPWCYANTGVVLYRRHPIVDELLTYWYDSPTTGDCDPYFIQNHAYEQACFVSAVYPRYSAHVQILQDTFISGQGMFVRHIYWYGPAVGPFREQLARVVQNYTFPSLFMPYDLARRPGATYRNARVQSRIRVPRHRHPNVTRWCLTVKKANQERNLGCGGPAPNVLHYTAPCPDS